MKPKLINLFFLLFFFQSIHAQKDINYWNFVSSDEKTFTNKEIQQLKNSTTYFVLREDDLSNKSAFEEAINSVWDLTVVKCITYQEFLENTDENSSFLVLQGYNTAISGGSMSGNLPHLFLTLRMGSLNFCRIEMFTSSATMYILINTGERAIESMYLSGNLKNWSPALLRLYLADVQKSLKESKREYLYASKKSKALLKGLDSKDTLYVLNYVETIYNKWNGKEDEKHDMVQLFRYCPMTVIIVTPDELHEKIAKGEVNYVFDYVKSCTDNYVRIYSLKNGRIYQKYIGGKYNLKSKYIKKIFR